MSKSGYVDIGGICQVLGCLYNNPKTFNKDDKYVFNKEDFFDEFHQIVFSAIYNCWQLGAKELNIHIIEDYLANRPKAQATYKANNGTEYILKIAEVANPLTFDYNYNRMKKFTLLRMYKNMGMDLSWYLDENSLDTKKLQEQRDKFDNNSLEDIANLISDKIDEIRAEYVGNIGNNQDAQLGDGALELLDDLKESPAFGIPFYTEYMNTVTRGARLGKFYLRSAPTGAGKSRSMVADICYWGCSQMFNLKENKWISTGMAQSCLYIATEQDLTEITTMALSFIAGVDEEHILQNSYYLGEEERVRKAATILKNGKVYFVCIPDFSLQDIENVIKKYIREKQVQYIGFDYIHSSPSILQAGSGVKNLREDSVLFLLSSHLKDICVQYGVFIESSTQLNMSWVEADEPDQNCLRGSKAIADRVDVGMILLDVTAEDIEKLKGFCSKNGLPLPTQKLSIYKNRAGQHRGEYLWLDSNKGCCRFNGLFLTNWNYKPIDAPDIKIKIAEESIF